MAVRKVHAVRKFEGHSATTLCGIGGPTAQEVGSHRRQILRGRKAPVDVVVAKRIVEFECSICRIVWRKDLEVARAVERWLTEGNEGQAGVAYRTHRTDEFFVEGIVDVEALVRFVRSKY